MVWALFYLFWAEIYLIIKLINLLLLRSFLKNEFSYCKIELFNFIKICLHLLRLVLLFVILLLQINHLSLYLSLQAHHDATLIIALEFILSNLFRLSFDLLFILAADWINSINLLSMLEFNQLLYVLYLVWLIGVKILRYHCN